MAVARDATVYFECLADLLRSIQATDGARRAVDFDEGAAAAVDLILAVRRASGKVLLIGNGGSAAIASHMQNDLSKAVGMRAMVFYEVPLLTAISNDVGYQSVFEHPIKMWANEGDLLIAISSSGRSVNILRGVDAAKARRCRVVTFSGFAADNPLRGIGDLNFYVPSDVYGHVELTHYSLAHYLSDRAASRATAGGQAI